MRAHSCVVHVCGDGAWSPAEVFDSSRAMGASQPDLEHPIISDEKRGMAVAASTWSTWYPSESIRGSIVAAFEHMREGRGAAGVGFHAPRGSRAEALAKSRCLPLSWGSVGNLGSG